MNTILPQELKDRLENGELLHIIDVREAEEVANRMIPGAKHIPLGQLSERYKEIPESEEAILVCRTGNRSSKAYEYLVSLGYNRLKNMTGGMMAWENI